MRLLLVDDDLHLLDTARDILEDAGHDVQTAGTKAEALRLVQQSSFQVLIVDLNLPDGTGLSLVQDVREKTKNLHICLMTGEAAMQKVAPRTVDDVLLKPVDPTHLLAHLEALHLS